MNLMLKYVLSVANGESSCARVQGALTESGQFGVAQVSNRFPTQCH